MIDILGGWGEIVDNSTNRKSVQILHLGHSQKGCQEKPPELAEHNDTMFLSQWLTANIAVREKFRFCSCQVLRN